MVRRINRPLTTSPAHTNHFMGHLFRPFATHNWPAKDSAERGSRREELSHANHRRRRTYQRSCLRRRNRRAHAQGKSANKAFPGVRSSAFSLFETKSARHGKSFAGRLEPISREDRY